MKLFEQIRGAAPFPNLDFTTPAGEDLSAKQYLVMLVDEQHSGKTVDVASPYPVVAGVLQNAPSEGEDAVIRYLGWTFVRYSTDVAFGDYLKLDTSGGNEGKVRPFLTGKDGHAHGAEAPDLYALVHVDSSGTPVTGLMGSDFTFTLDKQDSLFLLASASETISVYEIGGGDYWLTFTPTDQGGVIYRLKVTPNTGGQVATPSEFQLASTVYTAVPATGDTHTTLIGQAIQAGLAGELGLCILKPQII
jgi:hypothetical protein